ncbi:PD-(D/E)XK motif protein [Mycoplasma struthionis]|uniref:PD-(D/E)XK motif protein n=1 Tax=Mycoplasma struthionis TaxID=538220 RepID=A0A502M7T9_9MOLU|nr:PD-(D/E)XK motif protein [Mycoplasma struthionis]TPI02373.1 PD-(D/E)XK motif protein [Mycoplasma struthionis]
MKNKFKYISEISLSQLENGIVLPFIDEIGRTCILIKNINNKDNVFMGATDILEYHLNSLFQRKGKNYYFHNIICLKNDTYSIEQFYIAYEYLFESIKQPKSDNEILTLINSLEELFKTTPENDKYKLHVGVYGELLFLNFLYENNCPKILSKYHRNFFAKHDIELDDINRIEIKTTTSSKRIHNFSHDQIFRNDINVYVASILLEESVEGCSLYDLFKKIMSFSTESKLLLSLGKLKGYCSINKDNPGPTFSYNKAIQDLKIFSAKELPHISSTIPDTITNIKYDVDCSTAKSIHIKAFAEKCKELLKNK